MDLSEDEIKLFTTLSSLHDKLRDKSYRNYVRINPFCEDLFSWKERGRFWSKKNNVTIYNSTTVVGDVEIGEDTWIGPFCSLDGTGGLKIGKNCSISLGCQIMTHDTVKWALSGGVCPYDYASVVVGNRCFLGVHSLILKGVAIGDCCVVGAGAIVTKDVPSYSIVAGSPSVIIGRVCFSSDGAVTLKYI